MKNEWFDVFVNKTLKCSHLYKQNFIIYSMYRHDKNYCFNIFENETLKFRHFSNHFNCF